MTLHACVKGSADVTLLHTCQEALTSPFYVALFCAEIVVSVGMALPPSLSAISRRL